MSQIVNQNPGSSEVQSPLIAGVAEGLNKISAILNLKTSTLEDVQLNPVPIDDQESNKNRIYEANTGNRLWLSSPAPVFKKNGEVITQSSANFSIDYIGGSITFPQESKPTDSDTITVSATYIIAESDELQKLSTTLSDVKTQSDKYKGNYNNLGALQLAYPSAQNGDFAIVFDPLAVYAWKNDGWYDTRSIEDLSNYYKKGETDNLLDQKEPKISAHGSSTSDDDYYWGGRKTWQNISTKVRSVVLSGLSTASSAVVTASDSILSAIGKLQAQVSKATQKAYLTGTGAPSTSTAGVVGQRYVNTSNGDWYTCKSAGDTYVWEQGQGKISSLKNPYALTISLNGSSQGAYDGSSAKSINVTPSAIGAAPSSHNQDADTITGLTPNFAMVSDVNGHPAVSSVTKEELEYLDGVTSNIQNQLGSTLKTSGGTVTGTTVFQNGLYAYQKSTGGTPAKYLQIATIAITGVVVDVPIELIVVERDYTESAKLSIKFEISRTSDPNLQSFRFSGYGKDTSFAMVKTAPGVWAVYTSVYSTFDSLCVTFVNTDWVYLKNRATITLGGETVNSLPDGAVYATFYNPASALAKAVKIGNASFDGTKSITLDQIGALSATGTAAAATKLATSRKIGNANFDGTESISLSQIGALPSGGTAVAAQTAAACTGNAASATKLQTARKIGNADFNGTANITLDQMGALSASFFSDLSFTSQTVSGTSGSVSFSGTVWFLQIGKLVFLSASISSTETVPATSLIFVDTPFLPQLAANGPTSYMLAGGSSQKSLTAWVKNDQNKQIVFNPMDNINANAVMFASGWYMAD